MALNGDFGNGISPIRGVQGPQHANQTVKASGWTFTEDVMAKFYEVNLKGKTTALGQGE